MAKEGILKLNLQSQAIYVSTNHIVVIIYDKVGDVITMKMVNGDSITTEDPDQISIILNFLNEDGSDDLLKSIL